MANALYPLWKQALLTESAINKGLDMGGANAPYVALLSGYTFNAAHQYYTDIASGIVGTPQPILANTVVGGLFSGQAVVFTAVTGPAVNAIAIYRQSTLANTTWRLVLYEDTGIVGFPVTPNGGNIILEWSASGIFQL